MPTKTASTTFLVIAFIFVSGLIASLVLAPFRVTDPYGISIFIIIANVIGWVLGIYLASKLLMRRYVLSETLVHKVFIWFVVLTVIFKIIGSINAGLLLFLFSSSENATTLLLIDFLLTIVTCIIGAKYFLRPNSVGLSSPVSV